jgi:hypothetical protein
MPTPISHSQIEEFNRCQRRWAYRKVLGLSPDGEDETALHYGDAVHLGLEDIGRSYLEGTTSTQPQAALLKVRERLAQLGEHSLVDLAESHLQGFVQHFLPGFLSEWRITAVEREVEHVVGEMHWRGKIDLEAINQRTGVHAVFDYKTSSAQYARELTRSITSSHQFANYCISHWRRNGSWPGAVGYIFLGKPRTKTPQNMCRPENFFMEVRDVSPQIAQFAISVEQADRAVTTIMAQIRSGVGYYGAGFLDHVPADFGACSKFGSTCGFSAGCHAGNPLHQQIAERQRRRT